ncbi:olfactory receptor 5J3-like [Cyrtonyx montezumae]|uniref:olfactory receptor 5J3-like n=1 Tax=Cyrtonyx montezumae TaxID=9017 RepID=UPI0032DAD6F4
MTVINHTTVTYFILLGLTDCPKLQHPLFVMILLIYVITLLGNLGMISLITVDFQLQTPMYFFLLNLSIVDLCYSSVFIPRMLVNILVEIKTISYSECLAQHFSFVLFATTEGFLLAAMAYDRYIAICNPLLYTSLMARRVCVCLVTGSYLGGLCNSLVHTCGLLKLSFCGPNTINHFFCDTNPLLQLTCSDNHLNELRETADWSQIHEDNGSVEQGDSHQSLITQPLSAFPPSQEGRAWLGGKALNGCREKSLGSLCRRFLARYPDYPSAEENYCICLDEVAEELKCERRRIYDIVHVLESLHMLSRLAQNKYIWHGRHNLAKTLHTLKKAGEENKYMLLIETIKKREYKDEFDLDGKRSEEVKAVNRNTE